MLSSMSRTGWKAPTHRSTLIDSANAVIGQLQQPVDTLLLAARHAQATGARVVLDGAPDAEEPHLPELLAHADVIRANAAEAEHLTSRPSRTSNRRGMRATSYWRTVRRWLP